MAPACQLLAGHAHHLALIFLGDPITAETPTRAEVERHFHVMSLGLGHRVLDQAEKLRR